MFSIKLIHERYKLFYSNRFQTEIEFIASHFSELCNDHEEEFSSLSNDTITRIVNNDHFKLNSEDEFLQISSICIPSSVKKICSNAFESSYRLQKVEF